MSRSVHSSCGYVLLHATRHIANDPHDFGADGAYVLQQVDNVFFVFSEAAGIEFGCDGGFLTVTAALNNSINVGIVL